MTSCLADISRRRFLSLTAAMTAGLAASASSVGAVPRPAGYLITRWRQDPWARGSYSFMAKGASPSDRNKLRKPVNGKLFFAGEATSSDFPATVHGALISGRKAAKAIARSEAKSVAVIGAGFSGLGAAKALSSAGRRVTVLEARNRKGGRVWTSHALGVPLDLGGSWINGVSGNPLTRLADDLGVARQTTDYDDFQGRDSSGQSVLAGPIPAWFSEVEVEQEYGADRDALSRQAFPEGSWQRGGDVLFPGGYSQLLSGLDGDYETRLNSPVTALDTTGADVQVTVGGQTQTFDAALVTVPLGVLKSGDIQFTPALPETNQGAIDRLGMGLLDKLYLKFDRVFWDDAEWIAFTTKGRNPYPTWLNLHKSTGQPILMAFAGGSAAEDRAALSDTEIVRQAIQALEQMYPT